MWKRNSAGLCTARDWRNNMWGFHPGSIYNSVMRGGYTYSTNTNLYEELKKTRESYKDDLVCKPKLAPITDPSYLELVRIALCYYIAKADGVSEDEQAILDQMCNDLISNPDTNPDYKTELRMILADKGTSFNNVRRYLKRVDPAELENFKEDLIRIAETTDGITDNELQALTVFRDYVNSQKPADPNEMMSGAPRAGTPKITSLKCQSCGANLPVKPNQSMACCPYCGSGHLITIS